MSRSSSKSWSPSKENLLMQHLAKLERSPSSDDGKKYGSQCSINTDNNMIDLPTEPKRRRIMAMDDTPSSVGSQVSSQMSSRCHSPSLSESLLDDSLMSTPSASPTGTMKEHFRRKYYAKDELWAAIETNYKYLMDKGIIEACQKNESDVEDMNVNSTVSFGEFLNQYKELTDWLKTIQVALQQKKASNLALSEKYLNQSYHDEIQRSPRLRLLNDYAYQLKLRQPILTEEIDVFLSEVNAQWEAIEKVVTPTNQNQDPESMLRDLEDDLEFLRKWLDGVEGHLRMQTTQDWPFLELEGILAEHKILQQDIESHSRVISAVLKLSERLQHDKDAIAQRLDRDSVQISAHNLERRWHGVWLQSLEWQCRLEDAISRRKGIFNSALYLDRNHFDNLREYTDDEYDSQDVDSFLGPDYRLGDCIQSPENSGSILDLSPDSDKSSGKDSAVASETEQKTCSDMSENYQDLSVSTGSDSDREFLRQIKMKKHDSRDIGYGSESQSDELEMRYPGITFSGINGRVRKTSTKCGDFYATVAVDTESTDKTDSSKSSSSSNNQNDPTTGDESDISAQIQQVLLQEESEMDIRYLIDQADIMVQQGNTFNKTFSPKRMVDGQATDKGTGPNESNQELLSSSSSSAPSRELVDKGVGTVESSCDASDEESGDSEVPIEECSMVTDDGTETIDSVVGSEYTSDEMRNCVRDNSRLPRLYDTNSLRTRLKGRNKERPWSVVELSNVGELRPLSASESAIDKLSGAHSDSDLPSRSLSQSASPTLTRHRIRRAQCLQRPITSSTSSTRSHVGAKRKLDLTLSPMTPTTATSTVSPTTPSVDVNSDTVATEAENAAALDTPISDGPNSETTGISGNATIVPLGESCTSDDEVVTPMDREDLISTLQNARFKSSGSSYDDSDTQGDGPIVSEVEDPNNDGNFSENAWDNYQAPLYPTGSEDPPEEALTWEPGEMEFDDEFSLPQSTILATLIARRSEDETYTGKHPKLVTSNKGNFDDSDSDIEDLHHVLEESRMQLKVADRSLRKKRKDPLKTGLYLNPGKYGELMATIETNIRCLESINQHLDTVDVTTADRQTIQDLLYQWEKLRALASDRRNQSQEVKTMYATLLSVEGVAQEGVPALDKTRFRDLLDLKNTVVEIQEKQKLIGCQRVMLADLTMAGQNFSTHNPSVSMVCFMGKIEETDNKLQALQHSCMEKLKELSHIEIVWTDYNEIRQELAAFLTEERQVIEKLLYSQELDIQGNRAAVEASLKTLVSNLSVYEDKLMALQQLRSKLLEISDEDTQTDLNACIADFRNQLFVAQTQCREIMLLERNGFHKSGPQVLEKTPIEEKMEVEEVVPVEKKPVPQPKKVMKVPQETGIMAWLKYLPLQVIALAVLLGLMYLAAPDSLHRLLDFSLRVSSDLKYVNGAPPM